MKLILAIDDDLNMLRLLEGQLSNLGFQVITAATGSKGLKLMETGHPDLILLDIVMPEMDGFQVLKNLKRNDFSKDIPIIMLTSKSGKEDLIQAIRLGISDYIAKPYDKTILGKKVNAALMEAENKKAAKEFGKTEYIRVTRRESRTIIEIRGSLQDGQVLEQARQILNKSFFTLAKYDSFILDLRSLPVLELKELAVLENIIQIFDGHFLHIVGGRHYGIVIAQMELSSNTELFISYGDFEVYLSKK
jgi:DNA-binding response OmpR family regulator